MSRNRITSAPTVFQSIVLVSIFLSASSGIAGPFQSADDLCISAIPVDLNHSFRGYHGHEEESSFVTLNIPSSGLLSVDVSVSGTTTVAPRLGFVSSGCGTLKTKSAPTVLERSATHQVLAIHDPGFYVFRVASQEPAPSLRAFRFSNGFAAIDPIDLPLTKDGEDDDELEIDPNPLIYRPQQDVPNQGGEDDDELEIDPNPSTHPLPRDVPNQGGEDDDELEIDPNPLIYRPQQDVPNQGGEDDDELEIDPNPATDPLPRDVPNQGGEDDDELEIDPNPSTYPLPQDVPNQDGEDDDELEIDPNPSTHPLSDKLNELCRAGEVDDHGDSFTCATILYSGQPITGEVRNGWGDDVDAFAIELGGSQAEELWSLTIEIASDVDTIVEIYDRSGTRLEKTVVDGGRDDVRIVRTLRPGVYFVRIGGQYGAEGAYELRVDASQW